MIAGLLTKVLPAPKIMDLRGMLKLTAIQGDVEEEKVSGLSGSQGFKAQPQDPLQVSLDLT
uniref:Uncharacterized protein n=1 Tax=Hyaloperonospora arabidopsidis (strain Emoy2) TaxID=559515 RepID=M4B3J9_HYAAE